jgi:hypothetical protein
MKSNGFSIGLLVLCVFLVLPSDSDGRDLTLNSTLAVSGRYDDNVLFSRTDVIEDYMSIINPVLSLDYLSEQTELKLGADVSFINYLDQTDLNTIIQKYFFDSNTDISERVNLETEFDYIKDTLLESELEETGRLFNREDRIRYDADGKLRFKLTQLSSVSTRYKFSRKDYEEDFREDHDSHIFGVNYSRLFNEGLDRLVIGPQYQLNYSNSTESDTYRLNIGWRHKSSEIGTFNFLVGGRYTLQESRQTLEEKDSTGFVANIYYNLKSEISEVNIGYRRDIYYDADDNLREIDRVYTKLSYHITERMRYYLNASYYQTRLEQTENDNRTRYLDILSWVKYRLTETYALNLSYRYSQGYDESEDDRNVRRSQVQLSLVLWLPIEL